MSQLPADAVLRPAAPGPRRWLMARLMAALPFAFRVARRVWPIPGAGGTHVATRHDDVREVFATDAVFAVTYGPNLAVITDGAPFLLGLPDSPAYRAQLEAMRRVFRPDDLPALAKAVEARAAEIVGRSGGRVEVVHQLVRRVTFDILCPYLGVPEPQDGRLDIWATRLFEFQFASSPRDVALREEVDRIAPALRRHIDAEIARRKKGCAPQQEDVLARCLALQHADLPGYTDTEIRTALLCMVVGGPPQPPMVVPQALEQLLLRPEALRLAMQAARDDQDDLLRRIVREAMRFDPLAPALPRQATQDWTLARGTRRAKRIRKGDAVLAAFASAMMDERRLPSPDRFDPHRLDHEYIHFGHGLHECFGRHINAATLHLMLKPLLRQPALRRAPGPEGRLRKNGPFAERLVVQFG